ncbi:PREDICTED: aspartic proteinase Asp1-like [Populus euphratica]|uniref:Aspartic proteinase Asp1 n=1 Tax=Populus euphratica TaxID=75702 RepID=A0AAJ6U485_POPEU|nr:PREDICTED: aspartic proteinase Asp1-like [Populus euphratica]
MGKEKMGFWVVGVLVLVLILGSSATNDDRQQRWRKAMMSGETTGSSMLINRVPSSIVLPLHGNVYPIGFYNVTLNIGQPSKPYFLDVDTGSDLTYLQCDTPRSQCTEAPHPYYKPSNNLVAWSDPICQYLRTSSDKGGENPGPCYYEVVYADGGSSFGILVKDAFNLNFTSEKHQSPLLALGCGYVQHPSGTYHPIDGVLGLGRGKPSIVSQLSGLGLVRNVIGHCLSGRGGGFLFFGDDLYDSSRVVWTPMSPNAKYYSPGFAELTFDGKTTGFKNLIIAFDSGASYTYLNSQAYQGLISLIKGELSKKFLSEALDDHTLPICWKGWKPFESVRDVKKYFKTFALSFMNGGKSKTQLEFPPEAYLIISSKGNACLGILNGTEVGLNDLNVIGDISMQDRVVIYDNEKQLIGWAPGNCDRLPRSRSIII